MTMRRGVPWALAAADASIVIALGGYLAARPGAREAVGVLSAIAIERSGFSSSLPAMKPAAVMHGPDEIEICGGGWVKPPAAAADAIEGSLWRAAATETLAKAMNDSRLHADVVGRLRASPDDLAQATALLVEMAGLDRPLDPTEPPLDIDPAPAREKLATLAASSTDPNVYAMALKACRGSLEGACGQINPAQWARLDPGNAAPWVWLLDAAVKSGDRAGADEALHRIGASRRSDLGYFTTVDQLLRATPTDDASLLAIDRVVVGLTGVAAAVAIPGYQHVLKACRGDALRDANRAQTCVAVAETLAQRSDTLIDQAIGEAIGARVGWTDERVRRLRAVRSAYQRDRGSAIDNTRRFDCRSVRSRLDVMRVTAALGEVEAMKAWVARSGKSDADFQREDEAFRASFAKAAASAR